jgi:hypothetical protein
MFFESNRILNETKPKNYVGDISFTVRTNEIIYGYDDIR